MKITDAFWKDAETKLPENRGAFDLDDTIDAIVALSGMHPSSFDRVLEAIIEDPLLRRIIDSQKSYGLSLVTDEVREAVAGIFYLMKNPDQIPTESLSDSSVRILIRRPDPEGVRKAADGFVQRIDNLSAGRAGSSGTSKND